ncbi:MAG: M14 family metallopeptidase [Anaerolineae bacterium]|nr:M14 family metallopeptidase [Anaerolineae bacterium]
MDKYFPSSYEDSRARFLQSLNLIQQKWHSTLLETHPLKDHSDLSIDWLWAHAHKKETLVIISTAEHGIEGYVGSAMMKIFIEEFAPRLNPENTGLLLIHGLNPWGMKHHRKVNENSVDLNRNFVFDGDFDPAINPEFHYVENFINPQRRIESFNLESIRFLGDVVKSIIRMGIATITKASLLGQHHTPNGFFYGGANHQESTVVAMGLYRRALEEYQSVIQIDMHTGYGPRYQMSIIMSPLDPMTSEETSQKFNYPLVLKINAEEFYDISGDMAAYYYNLRNKHFPDKQLFACGFEFGTFGSSLPARIRSLRAMVFENQLHWHGAKNEQIAGQVRREFDEFYFPHETKWREKALTDARQAFDGILRAYQLL